MNIIHINENYIRQLVSETVKNLILGEDEINTQISTDEIIRLIQVSKQKFFSVVEMNKSNCIVELVYENEKYNDILLYVEFEIDGYITDEDKGDYLTPPSGGEFELEKIEITNIETFIDEDEINIQDEKYYSFIEKIIEDNFDEKIYKYIDPEDFKYEYFDDLD